MSIRARVLLYGAGTTSLTLLLLGMLLVSNLYSTLREQIELRVQAFALGLAPQCTMFLASNRIERLDQVLSGIMEEHIELLDIKFAAVIDNERRVVGHTDKGMYGRILHDDFSAISSHVDTLIMREQKRGDANLFLIGVPLETRIENHRGIRWGTLIVGMDTKGLKSRIYEVVLRTIFIILCATLLTVLISYSILSRSVVKPIRALTQTAKSFAMGEWHVRAKPSSTDEIASLASTFNEMADRINANREMLEKEVAKRTEELRQTNELLKEMAITDGLTNLYNYRYFKNTIVGEIQRHNRTKSPLSLMMIDVDYFKNFNDTHGHPAGDQVLKTIATLLKERLRSTDIICRYGGEEFAVILIDTRKNLGLQIAEEIRWIVENHHFEGEETQPNGKVTISIGVAGVPEDGTDPDQIIEKADNALYRAKQSGRNKVVGA